jgi:nucleoid-associated protein YgaU
MSQRHSHAVEGVPEQPPEAMEEPGPRLRVFWGRIAALAFAIVLSFFAGWFAAPRDVDAARVRALEADLVDARDRIDDLESTAAAETDAVPAPDEGGVEQETPSPQAEDDEPVAEEPAEQGSIETYVVQPGDTLQGIADQFYADPTLDNLIAEANGIDDPALIHSGLELEIPERPDL